MSNEASNDPRPAMPSPGRIHCAEPVSSSDPQSWHTFEDVLYGLHRDGILLHPYQLAEFLLVHGLPVDLRYVPVHLKQKAIFINHNYLGEMAQLDEVDDYPWFSYSLV